MNLPSGRAAVHGENQMRASCAMGGMGGAKRKSRKRRGSKRRGSKRRGSKRRGSKRRGSKRKIRGG